MHKISQTFPCMQTALHNAGQEPVVGVAAAVSLFAARSERRRDGRPRDAQYFWHFAVDNRERGGSLARDRCDSILYEVSFPLQRK
jgi:hypothetical protein